MLPGFPMPLFGKSGPPAIGQPWRGGYYIGDIIDGGVLFYLVLAPKSAGQNNSLQWKTTRTGTAGTTSLTNGYANLQAMISAGITEHPAGDFCRNLTIGGFSDWYYPAEDELIVVFQNRGSITGVDAIDQDNAEYWSSSQKSSTQALAMRFVDGRTSEPLKTNGYRVRAMRRVAA